MNKLTEAITKVVVELIETKANISEIERARLFTASQYYYNRLQKLNRRLEELEEILLVSKLGYDKDTPVIQFLVTER